MRRSLANEMLDGSALLPRSGMTGAAPALRFPHVDPGYLEDAAAGYALSEAQVDVWGFSLRAQPGDVDRWLPVLSDDERSRAARFVRDADRESYIVAHGVLRRLLARYCGTEPQALIFSQTHDGKPTLAQPSGLSLHFNLAHSGGAGLLAVSRGCEVGVDLEAERDDIDTLSIARRFFCAAECAAIEGAQPALRSRTFLRYWVAKEAVLKAHGSGLACPLDAIEIRFSADGDTASVFTTDASMNCDRWLVRMLAVPAGWLGALCAPRERGVGLRVPAESSARAGSGNRR